MTATAESIVNELTDKAIVKRIGAIDRAIFTRDTHVVDLNLEIDELNAERAKLVQIQIDRLKKQLPGESQ